MERLAHITLGGLLIGALGCPYVGPIEPVPVETSFRPVIVDWDPEQLTGLSYSPEITPEVSFNVSVQDSDSTPQQLRYEWILDRGLEEEQTLAGPTLALTEFPLSVDAFPPGSFRLSVVILDQDENEAQNEWRFSVQ